MLLGKRKVNLMKPVKFERIKKQKILIKFISIFIVLYISIITIKYYLTDTENSYFDYMFSIDNFTLISFLVFISFILNLLISKRVEYDNEKVCLYSNSILFNKKVCIKHGEIVKITNRLGIISIRTIKNIIVLDNFMYDKQDLKNIMTLLEMKTSKAIINPKMESRELYAIIFFILLLMGLYLSISIVIYL